ncbi:hypothetical protein EYF80_022577 [Liparis tanakae]|uniref:Uncharacterized protein n=1 Tax=Liparis tanakae TaxID=230148 RepID=A0A4Z2HNH8_9TELE|nr:hypothetical protein EYF80_022577 [Liparis tanakae]
MCPTAPRRQNKSVLRWRLTAAPGDILAERNSYRVHGDECLHSARWHRATLRNTFKAFQGRTGCLAADPVVTVGIMWTGAKANGVLPALPARHLLAACSPPAPRLLPARSPPAPRPLAACSSHSACRARSAAPSDSEKAGASGGRSEVKAPELRLSLQSLLP